MSGVSIAGGFDLPFQEQIDFFRAKINLPTERWDDIRQSAHDRAFVVAGATKADLLNDLRAAVDKAKNNGTTLETFREDFKKIVADHGWTGWTGEGTKAGEAWRTRVIYETNLRSSYAAGRWAQLNEPAFKKLMPYWRYVHNDSVLSPRPLHQHWGQIRLTLPADHIFWKTHFPPNGWGCRCRIVAVAMPQEGDATEPPENWVTISEKTGAPLGFDKGWGYAPGANATRPLKEFIDNKLINLPASIGADMYQAMRPVMVSEMTRSVTELVDAAVATGRASGNAALVHVVSPKTVAALADIGHPLESADIWLRDSELLHALRDTKGERGASIPAAIWRGIVQSLDLAIPFFDNIDPALVYVFDLAADLGKVVVRVNYAEKMRVGGVRTKLTSNFVRTGGIVKKEDVIGGSQYTQLEK